MSPSKFTMHSLGRKPQISKISIRLSKLDLIEAEIQSLLGIFKYPHLSQLQDCVPLAQQH